MDKLALVPQDTSAAAEPEVEEGDASSFTPRQQRFVGEYIRDLNATHAAIRAGYSARSANEIGTRLLAKPHVRAAVEAAKRQRADRVKLQADDVVRELMLLATADVSQAFDGQGRLKPLQDIPEQVRRSICALEARIESGGARGTAGGAKAYSGQVATLRWDKMRAIELGCEERLAIWPHYSKKGWRCTLLTLPRSRLIVLDGHPPGVSLRFPLLAIEA